MAVDAEEKSKAVEHDVTSDLVFYHDSNNVSEKDSSKLLSGKEPSTNKSISSIENYPFIVYGQRWLMLFIFSLNTAMTGCLFISLSPISDRVQIYHNVPSTSIAWLSNICFLAYLVLAIPATYMISRWGIRPVIFAATACNFAATVFRLTGYKWDRFYLVAVGQVFVVLSYSALLQIPAKLSLLWFPRHERATVTSIGVLVNFVGIAIGFVQPTIMVQAHRSDITEREIKAFYLSQVITSAIIMTLTCSYKEKPPTPPCSASQRQHPPFIESISLILTNKRFILLSQSYAIYYGLFYAVFNSLNSLVTVAFPIAMGTNNGWLGVWNILASIVSFVCVGRLLDRFHKYKNTAIVLNVSSMVVWLLFMLTMKCNINSVAAYVTYVILGIFFLPYIAVGLEQAAEMTYPVSEEISSAILLLIGNVYAFAFILISDKVIEHHHTDIVKYVIAGFYLISTLLATIVKTDLNRFESEEKTGL